MILQINFAVPMEREDVTKEWSSVVIRVQYYFRYLFILFQFQCGHTVKIIYRYGQHFPLYRESDANCNETDEAPYHEKMTKFKEKWDCLSQEATDFVSRPQYNMAVYFSNNMWWIRSY